MCARPTGRLQIDPGVTVKLKNSRVELERGGAQLIAEGESDRRITFTSFNDLRYGAGGEFDTNSDAVNMPAPGNWGGIVLNAGASASIDRALLASVVVRFRLKVASMISMSLKCIKQIYV